MKQEKLNKRLYKAIKNGNLEKAKSLINKGADVSFTLLYNAAAKIFFKDSEINKYLLELTKLLLENGADPNLQTATGQAPLYYAVRAEILILSNF